MTLPADGRDYARKKTFVVEISLNH